MQPINSEFQAKISILRRLLGKHKADALLLRRVSSFAWATCGATSYVNTATSEGAASLLITAEHLYLVTNNIEAPRLEQEEKLGEQGWKMHVSAWETPMAGLQFLTAGLKLASDVPFPGAQEIGGEIARLRAHLTPAEGERFRQLGRLCSETLSAAGRAIHPGMSEDRIAAIIGTEAQQRGVQPIVNLVGTDERTLHFRHPLPTGKKLEKYAMLVLSGRQHGLVCSITRLVQFGRVPEETQQRIQAVAQVNATLIGGSRPGRSLGEVLEQGKQAYAQAGFPDEWRQHHQGGVTGYEPREYLAVTGSEDLIAEGQALAWNPSIAGVKMEDTILVGRNGHENLTFTPDWPTLAIEIIGRQETVQCALVLER
jgi:Xaa-Pro aminopeptidase